jgi:hypothetical protein
MNQDSHRETTTLAYVLLTEIDPEFPLPNPINPIAEGAVQTDFMGDLELVDVEGNPIGNARDDPHKDELLAVDDKPHCEEEGYDFTAFNHFIDIRKGQGTFDDYDGYSYNRGSGSVGQFENATEAVTEMNKIVGLLVEIVNSSLFPGNIMLDAALMWWYNDEYVHAPGQEWYRACSSSVEQYSYFRDKGVYSSLEQETLARFPMAQSVGQSNSGVPYSVFMPVDNLARYWFNRYKSATGSAKRPEYLGRVMHAIQDASIPHHAAGCMGNWHGKYEGAVGNKLVGGWATEKLFRENAKALFLSWMKEDQNPPKSLNISDHTRTPGINWSIEMLVTWMALNSFNQYTTTYGNFRNGFQQNDSAMKDLTTKAVALSMLCMCKAIDYKIEKSSWQIQEPALWLLLS